MDCKTLSVPLSRIDQHDSIYRISTAQPIEQLRDSIRQMGVINPPFLIPQSEASYNIVSGFQRVAVCRELKWTVMPARVLRTDTNSRDCLGLAVADNAQHRELNIIEQARAVQKLGPFFDDPGELVSYAKNLGLPLSRDLIPRLNRLNGLSRSIQNRIAANTISLTISLELAKLAPEEAEALSGLFHEIRPTLSQQKEMLFLVKDIARARDHSITAVLKNGDLPGIRRNPDFNRQQKVGQMLAFLRKQRYPRIHRFGTFFARNLRALDLPANLSLKPPANFEDTRFSMTIDFHSPAGLKTHIQTLQSIADNPHFINIIDKRIDDPDPLH